MATTKITSPELFELGSLNTALKLPSGTTAERPTSPSTGEWRYNTTTNLIEFYDGGAWRDLQSQDIPPIASEHFNTVTYSGTSATQSITGVGFKPDWVWIKRTDGSENHYVQDSSRGSTYQIYTNLTDAEFNETGAITSFDSDGWTMGSYNGINNSGEEYVAWCWKANGGTTSSNTDGTISSTVQVNTKGGFSIVQYTANGTGGATVGHGLNSAPELIILKNLDRAGYGWLVYHKDISPAAAIVLNTTGAKSTQTGYFNDTATTSTVFTLGSDTFGNYAGDDYIAYCFESKAEYSKFGSYTGNGSTNGPVINTGFEPAFLMIKRTDTADAWYMYDNKRTTTNPRNKILLANTNDAELTNTQYYSINFYSNGFQLKSDVSTATNDNGGSYIYIAFASTPSTAPVLANSFTTATYNGTGTTNSLTGFGLRPDLAWFKCRNVATGSVWHDTVRGPMSRLFSYSSSAESNVFDGFVSFDSDGVTLDGTGSGGDVNASGRTYVVWNWKANPMPTINNDGDVQSVVSVNQAAGFSIINFTTPSTNNFTVGHGLGAAPDLVIYKCLSQSSNWTVYDSISGAEKYLLLNGSGAQQDDSLPFNDTEPTSTVLNLGSATVWWATNANYIAYAIKSISGFSKISTYTGTGTGASQGVTGLGFSPNWVMIKEVDGADSWQVYDTSRGAGQVLYPNGVNAEVTDTSLTSFDSDGFTVTGNPNESGKTYLYAAFKENVTTSLPAGELEFMVVAGGGGGGTSSGGYGVGGSGGGAGGLRTSLGVTSGGGGSAESNITLSAGTYTITIGAGGGTGGAASGTAGSQGSDSSITGNASITSTGGGAGDFVSGTGGTGGSGGGGYQFGGSGTANQGYNGSNSTACGSSYKGGAGGGAGAAASGKNGGAGLVVNGTTYAGGGGGGQSLSCGGGSGGSGGGANGQDANFYTVNATANTGGGGGGGVYNLIAQQLGYGASQGGSGGSGVVILQMNASDYSGNTTGSPTVSSAGGLVTLTYTGSGTYVHS